MVIQRVNRFVDFVIIFVNVMMEVKFLNNVRVGRHVHVSIKVLDLLILEDEIFFKDCVFDLEELKDFSINKI